MTIRDRIDRAFEAWGHTVYARRYLVLVLCLLFVATMATFLPDIRVENSSQSYLHSADPASLQYEQFQRRFGHQDDRVLIAIEAPEIFDLAFLERLRAFHEQLEADLPHVREVTSLINVRQTRGEGDALIVEDLMEDWPQTAEDLEDLRRRVFANPLYVDNVISRDGHFTTVSIEPVVYSGGERGVELSVLETGQRVACFSECCAAYVVETADSHGLETLLTERGAPFSPVGVVHDQPTLRWAGQAVPLSELRAAWSS